MTFDEAWDRQTRVNFACKRCAMYGDERGRDLSLHPASAAGPPRNARPFIRDHETIVGRSDQLMTDLRPQLERLQKCHSRGKRESRLGYKQRPGLSLGSRFRACESIGFWVFLVIHFGCGAR